MSCRTLDAQEALKLGLCDKVLEDSENAIEETKVWLKQLISDHDSSVISAMKQAVNNSSNDEIDFERERNLFAPLWSGPANQEALSKNLKH
jgi:enoyl-CoA hydratase/carnithine racemase